MANKILKLNATNTSDVIKINGINLSEVFNGTINQLSGVDLNTVLAPGAYYFAGGTNAPSGANGLLLVFRVSVRVRQFFFRYGTINTTDGEWFTRSIQADGSIVGTWRRISDSYIAGDSLVFSGGNISRACSGFVQNATTFWFTIPLGKIIQADSITFGNLQLYVRGVSGSILSGVNVITDSNYAVNAYLGNNYINVQVQSSKLSMTANTPITVSISSGGGVFA